MVFEGGAFGRQLGHEDGILMNEISTLVRSGQRASLLFTPCEDTMRSHQLATHKEPSPEPDHAGTLVSHHQPLQLWEINVCYYKPPHLWYFVTTAQTKITYLELSSGVIIFLPYLIFKALPSHWPVFNLQLFHRKYDAFGVNRWISKQNFQLATSYSKNSIAGIQLSSCEHPALAWSIR